MALITIFTKSIIRLLFTNFELLLCFYLLISVLTYTLYQFKKKPLYFDEFPKEYVDLQHRLTELKTREKYLLERRTATCSTSSAEPSPPCTTPSSSGATSPIPSSRSSFTGSDHPFSPPLRAHIRVYLPNHQYTVVCISLKCD